jgi:hypothetical protein
LEEHYAFIFRVKVRRVRTGQATQAHCKAVVTQIQGRRKGDGAQNRIMGTVNRIESHNKEDGYFPVHNAYEP